LFINLIVEGTIFGVFKAACVTIKRQCYECTPPAGATPEEIQLYCSALTPSNENCYYEVSGYDSWCGAFVDKVEAVVAFLVLSFITSLVASIMGCCNMKEFGTSHYYHCIGDLGNH
jgi:hypothetical protein